MLRDHAAQRHADDMRAVDAEMVGQTDAVGCHVGERIGGAHRQADGGFHEHPFEIRYARRLEARRQADVARSEEHTSELQSLMRISYAVFCLKKKKKHNLIANLEQIQTVIAPLCNKQTVTKTLYVTSQHPT